MKHSKTYAASCFKGKHAKFVRQSVHASSSPSIRVDIGALGPLVLHVFDSYQHIGSMQRTVASDASEAVARRSPSEWVWKVTFWRDQEWTSSMKRFSDRPMRARPGRYSRWENAVVKKACSMMWQIWRLVAKSRQEWRDVVDQPFFLRLARGLRPHRSARIGTSCSNSKKKKKKTKEDSKARLKGASTQDRKEKGELVLPRKHGTTTRQEEDANGIGDNGQRRRMGNGLWDLRPGFLGRNERNWECKSEIDSD